MEYYGWNRRITPTIAHTAQFTTISIAIGMTANEGSRLRNAVFSCRHDFNRVTVENLTDCPWNDVLEAGDVWNKPTSGPVLVTAGGDSSSPISSALRKWPG